MRVLKWHAKNTGAVLCAVVFLDTSNRKGSSLPRKARQVSESSVYHVILRGINKQSIFEDDDDAELLLGIIEGYKEISVFE